MATSRSKGCILGVNLRDIFNRHEVPASWYRSRRIAVDGHNVAFRYLTSIRGRDGDMLRNDEGRVTGHLYGFMGLVKQFRERGAEPIIIWDGPVHPRKQATVEERIRKREETLARAEAAKAAGDATLYARLMRGTVYITDEMIQDCNDLLAPLGVATTRADHDGERYAAALCGAGHADAVATEDYDALVAGAPVVLRKAGAQDPFLHRLTDLDGHGLSQQQLRQMAIVCGTDWHPGVRGFGAKTALKALSQFSDLAVLFEEAEVGREDSRFHKLVARSGMSAEEFRDLDRFIAAMPEVAAPRTVQPSPGDAVAMAEQLGVGRERALACFC